MPVVRWERARSTGPVDPVALDELAGALLVLDGVTAADEPRLGWCDVAPCVVVGCVADGEEPPAAVDVVVRRGEADEVLPALAGAVAANPGASRALVDVLRATVALEVIAGLALESLAYSMLLAGPEFATWSSGRPEPRSRDLTEPAVRVSREATTLHLTLNRPENRNAFSAPMRDALWEALSLADVDAGIEHVLLDAEGPVFSSGGDLGEFGTTPDVVTAHEIRTRRSVGAALARLSPSTTVRVQGACVGAGVELSAFATRLVADPGTTFRLPEVGMGLIPGAGGTVSVTRRIGRQATARMALLGEVVDARQALALGLVDELD